MAALADIVIDCAHPAALARFWAAALDRYRVAAYNDEELVRLRSMGIDDPEDDPSVLVEPIGGDGPRLWCQRVPEAKRVKNRVHLDLHIDDLEREVGRLVVLGVQAVEPWADGNGIVMVDPEGNEFCLARG